MANTFTVQAPLRAASPGGHRRASACHSLLHRPVLSAGRHGDGRAWNGAEPTSSSHGANLLRPADGQHRLHRRGPAAGRTVSRRFSRRTITSSPRRAAAWRWCGTTTTEYLPRPAPASRRSKAKTFELCEFLTDVLQVEQNRRAVSLSRRPASKLPRPARTAAGQFERDGRRAVQQGRQLLELLDGIELVEPRAARRVLRLRRHVRGERRSRVVHDGRGSHSPITSRPAPRC